MSRPDEFKKFADEFGLYESNPDFKVNDYCNWAPAHRDCNQSKSDFRNSHTIFLLAGVAAKVPTVREKMAIRARRRKTNRVDCTR
jgi:hypothetical protein